VPSNVYFPTNHDLNQLWKDGSIPISSTKAASMLVKNVHHADRLETKINKYDSIEPPWFALLYISPTLNGWGCHQGRLEQNLVDNSSSIIVYKRRGWVWKNWTRVQVQHYAKEHAPIYQWRRASSIKLRMIKKYVGRKDSLCGKQAQAPLNHETLTTISTWDLAQNVTVCGYSRKYKDACVPLVHI